MKATIRCAMQQAYVRRTQRIEDPLVPPLNCEGSAKQGSGSRRWSTTESCSPEKARLTYPTPSRARSVVLAGEMGGRCFQDARTFIRPPAKAQISSLPVPRQLLSREQNRERFGEEMETDSKASAAAGGETEWWLGRITFSSLLFWTQDAGARPHFLAGKDVVGSHEWHDVVANLFISWASFVSGCVRLAHSLCSVGPLRCVYSWICCTLGISCNLATANFLVDPLQLHFSRARACRVPLPLRLQLSGRVASALPRHLTTSSFFAEVLFGPLQCFIFGPRLLAPPHWVAVEFVLAELMQSLEAARLLDWSRLWHAFFHSRCHSGRLSCLSLCLLRSR